MTSVQSDKGNKYERELAHWLNVNVYGGPRCERAPLSGGGRIGLTGGSDITGTPGLFIEAKRTERVQIHGAMRQAARNVELSFSPEAPVVITRRNRVPTDESLVCLHLKDFAHLYRAWLKFNGYMKLGRHQRVNIAEQDFVGPPTPETFLETTLEQELAL